MKVEATLLAVTSRSRGQSAIRIELSQLALPALAGHEFGQAMDFDL